MTDQTERVAKPGFELTADLRDSELWRALADNLRLEVAAMPAEAEADREMSGALADMLYRAATDSDAGMFTPEFAESLDRLAHVVAGLFAPDWTVPA